jgi:ElaB/YqjD/DUF883 family membrane-anchored ribosome-binding protein
MVSCKPDGVLTELRRVLGEIDGVLKAVAGDAEGHTGATADAAAAADRLQESLGRVRSQLGDLEQSLIRELQLGWEATDRYVRDNAWVAIGAAALIGFFAGAIAGRRR